MGFYHSMELPQFAVRMHGLQMCYISVHFRTADKEWSCILNVVWGYGPHTVKKYEL
jgi:hypothetical protein